MQLILAHGEVVSHLFLVQRSEVRILVGQPYMNNLLDKIFFRSQNLNHINLGFKNIKKIVEGAIRNLNGSKDYRPAGWFPGAGVPESGAQVRACDEEEKRRGRWKKERSKARKASAKV